MDAYNTKFLWHGFLPTGQSREVCHCEVYYCNKPGAPKENAWITVRFLFDTENYKEIHCPVDRFLSSAKACVSRIEEATQGTD